MTTYLEPHDVRDYLADELSYPIEVEDVIDQIGDVKLEAPDLDRSERIGDLLEEVDDDHYDTADELNQIIHSMLPDEYIGRKFYDDRSNTGDDQQVRQDEEDQSL